MHNRLPTVQWLKQKKIIFPVMSAGGGCLHSSQFCGLV